MPDMTISRRERQFSQRTTGNGKPRRGKLSAFNNGVVTTIDHRKCIITLLRRKQIPNFRTGNVTQEASVAKMVCDFAF